MVKLKMAFPLFVISAFGILFAVTFQNCGQYKFSKDVRLLSEKNFGKIETSSMLDFGRVRVQFEKDLILMIKNNTPTQQTLTVVQPGLPFSIIENCTSIPEYETCALKLRYSPMDTQMHDGKILIKGTNTLEVDLRGQGYRALQVAETLVDFEKVRVGSTKELSVLVKNISPDNIALSLIGLNPPFSATEPCAEIPAQGSCQLKLRFGPDAAVSSLASINLESGPDSHQLHLKGLGYNALEILTPTTLDFGNVRLNISKFLPLTIKNNSDFPINVAYSTPTPPFYLPSGNPCSTLAAQQTCTMQVEFKSPAAGSFDQFVEFLSGLENPKVAIKGAGITSLLVASRNIDFGAVEVATHRGIDLLIQNTSQDPIDVDAEIDPIEPPTAPSPFYYNNNPCKPIAPGGNCLLRVKYKPTAEVSNQGRLRVGTPNGETAEVDLKGSGFIVPLPNCPVTAADIQSVIPNQPRQNEMFTVSFSNIGTWQAVVLEVPTQAPVTLNPIANYTSKITTFGFNKTIKATFKFPANPNCPDRVVTKNINVLKPTQQLCCNGAVQLKYGVTTCTRDPEGILPNPYNCSTSNQCGDMNDGHQVCSNWDTGCRCRGPQDTPGPIGFCTAGAPSGLHLSVGPDICESRVTLQNNFETHTLAENYGLPLKPACEAPVGPHSNVCQLHIEYSSFLGKWGVYCAAINHGRTDSGWGCRPGCEATYGDRWTVDTPVYWEACP